MERDSVEGNATYRRIVDNHVEKTSGIDTERLYQNTVAKYTWKNYGINYKELMYESCIDDYLHYEEEMLMQQDYEVANYEDTKPRD